MFQRHFATGTLCMTLALFVACGDASQHDVGDGGETRDTSPGDLGDTESPPEPMCEPAHGPLVPTPDQDIGYTTWTAYACLGNKVRLCLAPDPPMLEKLLRCEAIEGGWYWEQGSTAFQVRGRDQGACVVRLLTELEGGATVYECSLPLPMSPRDGLALIPGGEVFDDVLRGVREHCTVETECQMQFGAPRECVAVTPRPPLCPDFIGGLPTAAPDTAQ